MLVFLLAILTRIPLFGKVIPMLAHLSLAACNVKFCPTFTTHPMPAKSAPAQPFVNFAAARFRMSWYWLFEVSAFGAAEPFTSVTKSIEPVTFDVYTNSLLLQPPTGNDFFTATIASVSSILPTSGL